MEATEVETKLGGEEILKAVMVMLLCIGLSALGVHVYYQQTLVRRLSAAYGGFSVVSMNLNAAEINITVTVTNPSSLDANIDSYNLAVYLNGALVSTITSDQKQYIQASGTSDIVLNVKFSPLQALGKVFTKDVIVGLLLNYSSVVVRVAGTISLDHAGISLTDYPVDISSTIQELIS